MCVQDHLYAGALNGNWGVEQLARTAFIGNSLTVYSQMTPDSLKELGLGSQEISRMQLLSVKAGCSEVLLPDFAGIHSVGLTTIHVFPAVELAELRQEGYIG